MNDGTQAPRGPSGEELRFFGAVTASVSHEINNVLAMINELSGLLEDRLLAAGESGQVDTGRLRDVVRRIEGVVHRGKNVVADLNAFAHRVDHPDADLDLGQNIEQICGLCERFARLRRAELIARPPVPAVRLRGCAFILQHLVYRALEICLTTSGPDHPVTIESSGEDGTALIRLTGGPRLDPGPESARQSSALERLVEDVGGRLSVRDEPGQRLTLVLRLPLELCPPPPTSP